ncbi:MAG: right-handed parallel beta-helix repeat-containing protein [Deltaproteobacteria bacterium]|nr:right-handed parallel beta-helix repeat-containing protein [Deltaproteobacteria bacterium]
MTLWLMLLACTPDAPAPETSTEAQDRLIEQLVTAAPGAVIELPAGTIQLDRGLSLSADGVTLRGAGMDKTILSFKGQKSGAEGLLVTGNNFVIEDLAIEDSLGDALKIKGSRGVTIRRVRTEWTGGPKEGNGAYGLYPVQCEDVLIEESVAIGASDAGIYVGQSKNIVVRNSRAEYNVAGIEIENSTDSEVYGNTATHNTGGILIFDLPDLPVKNGAGHRVFKNTVVDNNTDNFAPEGNTVAMVPPGTGMLVIAANDVEVFENTIEKHDTLAVAVVSYQIMGNELKDMAYDPYVEGVWVHDNVITDAGQRPRGMMVKAASFALGGTMPALLWDGIVAAERLGPDGQLAADKRICFQRNGDGGFVNVDAPNNLKNLSRDLAPHDCALSQRAPLSLPQLAQAAPAVEPAVEPAAAPVEATPATAP